MMFNSKKNREQSSISEFVEQKTRLFQSKVVYALNGEHEHYFSKKDVLNGNFDTRCKVCGILLSEYRTEKRFEKVNAPVLLDEMNNTVKSPASIR
ncbi:MAG: hypothetical protein ACN4GR_04255 [Arenicellales bacterium]